MALDLSTNPAAIAQSKCALAYVLAQQASGELIAAVAMPAHVLPVIRGNLERTRDACREATAALDSLLEAMEGG